MANDNQQGNVLAITIGQVFIPSILMFAVYLLIGSRYQKLPSIVLFFLVAAVILFPAELGMILRESKRRYGRCSIKQYISECENTNNSQNLSGKKIFLYGMLLFAFAGLMSITVQPLENRLLQSVTAWIRQFVPAYFDWQDIVYIKQYSKAVLVVTGVIYFLFNVFIGPIIEELFFRGYLTNKLSRFGKAAPVIVTVLFSLYHLWLPLHNVFRIVTFYPAAFVAWKKKNIYISMVFHCACNFFATVSFLVTLYS